MSVDLIAVAFRIAFALLVLGGIAAGFGVARELTRQRELGALYGDGE